MSITFREARERGEKLNAQKRDEEQAAKIKYVYDRMGMFYAKAAAYIAECLAGKIEAPIVMLFPKSDFDPGCGTVYAENMATFLEQNQNHQLAVIDRFMREKYGAKLLWFLNERNDCKFAFEEV